MTWMLDTNICSYVIRRHPLEVKAQFDRIGAANIAISAVVMAELLFGAAKHPHRGDALRREIADFRRRLQVLPWTEAAAGHYAHIRADLERRGTPIGNMDLLIAAHALAVDAILVTNNAREFERVPGLRVEVWGP